MKIFIITIILGISTLFAQKVNNGSINFIFNGKKIDLPISTVTITKRNDIVLSLRCDYNGAKEQQMIGFDIALKKLSANSSALLNKGTKININIRNKINLSGQDLTVWFGMNNNKSRNEGSETANYSAFEKGQKASWQITSKSFKLIISEVEYVKNKLRITGKFNGSFSSKIAPEGKVAEIKNGTFTIII
jgi:hypothetical protein